MIFYCALHASETSLALSNAAERRRLQSQLTFERNYTDQLASSNAQLKAKNDELQAQLERLRVKGMDPSTLHSAEIDFIKKRAEDAENTVKDLTSQIVVLQRSNAEAYQKVVDLQKQLEVENAAKEEALRVHHTVACTPTVVNVPPSSPTVVQQDGWRAYVICLTHFISMFIGFVFGNATN